MRTCMPGAAQGALCARMARWRLSPRLCSPAPRWSRAWRSCTPPPGGSTSPLSCSSSPAQAKTGISQNRHQPAEGGLKHGGPHIYTTTGHTLTGQASKQAQHTEVGCTHIVREHQGRVGVLGLRGRSEGRVRLPPAAAHAPCSPPPRRTAGGTAPPHSPSSTWRAAWSGGTPRPTAPRRACMNTSCWSCRLQHSKGIPGLERRCGFALGSMHVCARHGAPLFQSMERAAEPK